MDLVPYMYYERQEPGSQLCAQHCLNNLLQQFTYTELDLADIARKLDQAENAALSNANQLKKSYNYNDTGYFSISVLERAMQVWDLTLVRWRGEAMKPYQEHPEDQAAFILNLASHWIPLRRFSPYPPNKASNKRWYNLNSFLPNGPEWISPTYLRMVLAQAEEEGYSVFCVRKAGKGGAEGMDTAEGLGWSDGGIGVLPECQADHIALELGEPVGRSGGIGSPKSSSTGASTSRSALAAVNPDQPTVDSSTTPPGGASSPPVRRRRRQEDLVDPAAPLGQASPSPASPPRPLRNPLRASQSSLDRFADPTVPSGFHDPATTVDSAVAGETPVDSAVAGETPDAAGPAEDDDLPIDAEQYHYSRFREEAAYKGPTDFTYHSRSYDDEDAALQAALKASMQDVPSTWVPPVLEPKNKAKLVRETSESKSKSKSKPAPAPVPVPEPVEELRGKPATPTRPKVETGLRVAGSRRSSGAAGSRFVEMDDDDDEPIESLSPGEIRRRRLAKFGGS